MCIPISNLDICWLRLDFESFTLQGTGNTEETDGTNGGGKCLDSFSVSVCSNILTYDIENLYVFKLHNLHLIYAKRTIHSTLMYSGLNLAWRFWLSTRFSCYLKIESVENILGNIQRQSTDF